MELFLSKPRGFCAGVVRAIEIVEEALSLYGAPIYVKHEIVHNRFVVEKLKRQGAIFIEDLEEVPEGSILIYSAHGVSPEVRNHAKKRGLKEIDATCGLVTRVHSAVKRYASQGYKIVLIGHKNHVEVIGTQGEAPFATVVVESVKDVEALDFSPGTPCFYITQTTLSLDDVASIREALLEKYPDIKTLNASSICYATTNRQNALKQIVGVVDLVLVIGDPQSSNSNRLCEVAKNRGLPAYLVNAPEEINSAWFEGVQKIALTAGASTPEEIVEACIERLKSLGVNHTEEVVFTEEDVVFNLPKELYSIGKNYTQIT